MSKEFKKLATTIVIAAIIFLNLGILAVKFSDSKENKQVIEIQNNTNLDYLINSADNYIKVVKPNTLYGIGNNAYTLYVVDRDGNLIREWQYFTD